MRQNTGVNMRTVPSGDEVSYTRCDKPAESTMVGDIEQLEKTARYLSKLAGALRGKPQDANFGMEVSFSGLQFAQIEYRSRRKRAEIFDDEGFACGPAWDILLDLFISSQIGRLTSVTDAALAAGCPPTTALRWISLLHSGGLVVRQPDESDQRRTFLHLTHLGLTKVRKALAAFIGEEKI